MGFNPVPLLTLNQKRLVLGLWIEQSEGAESWLNVVNELKASRRQRLAFVDGPKGFPEAVTSAFPQTIV